MTRLLRKALSSAVALLLVGEFGTYLGGVLLGMGHPIGYPVYLLGALGLYGVLVLTRSLRKGRDAARKTNELLMRCLYAAEKDLLTTELELHNARARVNELERNSA